MTILAECGGGGLGDVPARAGWCTQDMTGFLIQPRAAAPSNSSLSLGTLPRGGCRAHAEHRGGHAAVLLNPVMLLGGGMGGPQAGRSYLGTIFSTPPATDVTSADDDKMGLDNSLDAMRRRSLAALHALLEDVACRVQLLTVATAKLFHTHQPDSTLHPFDKQRGRAQRPMGTVRAQWRVSSGIMGRGL
ncbi:hypothetical protein B0H13DRAFT_2065102 [Mycena leptocephala]|nr:hypothetical protein B0H13DRAFT_2065102 [Mycena leptocephala]